MTGKKVQTMNATARLRGQLKFAYRQTGAVLAVSLILLLIVTLVAVSSMQGTALEEKMAGNARDRNLAFQTAESAVREAENIIDGVVSLGGFSGVGGLYGLNDAEPDFGSATTWSDGTQHAVSVSYYGSFQQPRFYVKQFTTVTGTEGALNMSGYGDNKGTGDVTIFKITGRGIGGNADSAEVILRSHYGRIF